MLESRGVVIESDGSTALVEVQSRAGCGHCAGNGGCATDVLSRVFPRRARRFRVANTLGAHPGDEVVVGVSDGALYRGSLAVYLVALAGLLAGATAGAWLAEPFTHPDLAAVIGAVLGLTLAWVWIRRFAAGNAGTDQQPRIIQTGREPGQILLLKDQP